MRKLLLTDRNVLLLTLLIMILSVSLEILNYYYILNYPYLLSSILNLNADLCLRRYSLIGSLVILSAITRSLLNLSVDYAIIESREKYMKHAQDHLEESGIYYRKNDNRDQRLTDEVKFFFTNLFAIIKMAFSKPFMFIIYLVQSILKCGYVTVTILLVQYSIGTLIIHFIAKKTSRKLYDLDVSEAYYRGTYFNFFQRISSIMSLNFFPIEILHLNLSISQLSAKFRAYANWNGLLSVLVNLLESWSSLTIYIILCLMAYNGYWTHLTPDQLVFLIQLTVSLNMSMVTNLNDFIEIFKKIPQLRVSYDRLKFIIEDEKVTSGIILPDPNGSIVLLDSFPISDQFGNIFTHVNLKLTRGEKLLIVGPCGIGKSSLVESVYQAMRTSNTKGIFADVLFKNVLYVVQDGYKLPKIFLSYANRAALHATSNMRMHFKIFLFLLIIRMQEFSNTSLKDMCSYELLTLPSYDFTQESIQVLKDLDIIPRFMAFESEILFARQKKNDISHIENIDKILSNGETQSLILASLLYHVKYSGRKADFLILLDEATSQVTEEFERKLMNELKNQKNVTLISVGHRSTLAEFHDRKIYFDQLRSC